MGCNCQSDLAEKARESMRKYDGKPGSSGVIILMFLVAFFILVWSCVYPKFTDVPPIVVTPPQEQKEPVEVPVAVAEVASDKDFEVKEPAPKAELTPEQKKAIDDQVKKSVADAVAAERRRAANREVEEKILKYAVKSILSDDDDDGGFGGW